MTELERRALLGDRKAQKQCTRQGIVLPCLKCYGKVKISFVNRTEKRIEMGFKCKKCGLELVYGQYLFKSGMDLSTFENPTPLAQWNDRPVPPIGRCGECINGGLPFSDGTVSCDVHKCDMGENDFCSYFEPKECEKQ